MKTLVFLILHCGLATLVAAQTPDQPAQQPSTQADQAETAPAPAEPLEVTLSGAPIEVEVVGDTVIMTGVEEDLAALQALIDQLDRDVKPKSYEVITIQNKNAQEVAQVVEQTLSAMITTPQPRPEETVTIRTISNNIIIATGPESKLEIVKNLIQQIDQVSPGLPEIESLTYELKHLKAAEAKTKLEELINKLRAMQGEARETEITIVPLEASNSLMIVAPKMEHDKIRQLLGQIDVEPTPGFGDLKLAYFPLLNSNVNQLATVLNDLFATAEGAEAATETIRRIRMVKSEPGPDGKLIELPPINLERQIKLIADEDSQALICATAEENIEPLRELINLLDGVPLAVEQGLRVFPLQYADAVAVKELLDDMFTQGKELPRQAPGNEQTKAVPDNAVGKSLVYNVGISADARTNTLVVTGRQEQLLLVEGVIEQIDVESMDVKHPLRLVTLTDTDATAVGKIIEGLWERRLEAMEATNLGEAAIARERIFLTVHLRSNSLLVSANEQNHREIQQIATTLNAAPQQYQDQIRIINCTVASAADLKTKIDELWQRKAELLGEAELPRDVPVVVADQRSNSLVIASSPEDYDEIKRLIEQLEAQPLAPIAEIRLIHLANNDASQIGEMLRQLFEERMQQRLVSGQEENPSDRVAVATEPVTNTILVASSRENFDEIARIVREIDIEPDLEGVVRIYVLSNAQAENVATKIEELFEKGLYTGVVTADNPIAEERQRVALVADPRSNAIVASASKTNLAIIEKLVQQMDTDRAPMVNADTRIFKLTHADSIKLAGMLDTLFQGMASTAEGEFAAPTIVAEPVSNTLIVTGSRDAIKRSAELLNSLDVEPVFKTSIRVYQLNHASAVKLTAKIQDIFDKRNEGVDVQRTPVYLMPDEPTNTIICSASEEDQSMAAHLLTLLDVPSTMSRQVEVFPLRQAKAEPTAESLERLFESQATTGAAGGAGRTDAIAVQPDRRTNSLIVWAAQSEMENIGRIIQKLDTSIPGPEMMVKVVTLRHALAEELSETLLNTLGGGEQQATGNDAQAVILHFEDINEDGTKVRKSLLRQDITIQPDNRTNSLFVMAPAGSMEMLESLIRSIDRIPPTVAEIRIFPLRNADAEEIVERLRELFEEQQTTEGPQTRLQITDAGAGPAVSTPTGAGAGAAPGQVLRFTADRRTNRVIAAGAQTDLDMVEKLILDLDSEDVAERVQLAFETRNIPATNAAEALRQYYEEENQLLSELDDASSIMRRAERKVTVVADEETNNLLVGVSPRYFSRTMDMLYSIDRPRPQVMIQVLIAEVALDDSIEFGMEFALQDLLFSENAVVGPNGVVKGNDFDFVGGTDVGAAGAAGSFGGFTFAITGEDFNFLLRALQSDGSLEVLSRPVIMVENNQEANITIGDSVPFLRGSNVSDSGQVNSTVEYEDVGIILNVTPHINPDGYVNLEINPEISSLNQGSNVQISEGLTAPTFTNRSAQTVITVKDSETVVIGGLIQTQEDRRETKVPILGDIPIAGNLFRATTSSRRRTELLIVLTVDVIRNEFDAYKQSVKMRDQSGFLPEEIKRNPLMQGLRILPGEQVPEYLNDERRKPRERIDRPLYGPDPDVYGPPTRKIRQGTPDTVNFETYGPPIGSMTKSVALSASQEK